MIVAELNVPVVPCYLRGTHSALPPGTKWPRPATITVHVGAPLTFATTANDRAGWMTISEQLAVAVTALRR
jgi:1-acyl-sn-glycerol-3-phosphate acyltransferase